MSVINDRDPVGDIHDLIQFEGYEQDSYALVPLPDQHLVHIFNGADIQSARGLNGDQQPGIVGDLSADDDLLLIAAGEAACREGAAIVGAHIVGFDQLLRKTLHLFAVDPASG